MAIPAGNGSRTAGATNHFFPKIDPTLAPTYLRSKAEIPSWFNSLFHRITMKDAYSVFQGFYPPGLPQPMNRGDMVRDSGFGEFSLVLYPQDYDTDRVPLHHNDVRDSNAPISLQTVAEQKAWWLARYEILCLEELLLGTQATYLHPEVAFTNLAGGSGLYSNSHSFNGQTLDNLVATAGGDFSAFIDDVWSLILQRRQMVDANGIPESLGRDEAMTKMLLLLPPELERFMTAFMNSELVLQSGATAPSDNFTMKHFGGKIEPHIWPMLSDDADFYAMFLNDNGGEKPLIIAEKEDLYTQDWNEATDWGMRTRQRATREIRSLAFGIGQFKCTAKVA